MAPQTRNTKNTTQNSKREPFMSRRGNNTRHVVLWKRYFNIPASQYALWIANNWAGISPSVFNDHHQHKSMLSLPGIRQTGGRSRFVQFTAFHCKCIPTVAMPAGMQKYCVPDLFHLPHITYAEFGRRAAPNMCMWGMWMYKFCAFFGLHWEVMILDQHITVHQMSA